MTARAEPVEARPAPDHLDSQPVVSASATTESGRSIEVIRKRADFVAANRGKRFVTPDFVLLAHRRRDGHAIAAETIRYGITVTKKIGNAVVRNRMKRRFRALVTQTLPDHGITGVDHILIGRKNGRESDFAAMQAELTRGLNHLAKKLG